MRFDRDDPRWTAYVLGELDPEQAELYQRMEEKIPEAAEFAAELRETAELLTSELAQSADVRLDDDSRGRILAAAGKGHTGWWSRQNHRVIGVLAAAAVLTVAVAAPLLYEYYERQNKSRTYYFLDSHQAASSASRQNNAQVIELQQLAPAPSSVSGAEAKPTADAKKEWKVARATNSQPTERREVAQAAAPPSIPAPPLPPAAPAPPKLTVDQIADSGNYTLVAPSGAIVQPAPQAEAQPMMGTPVSIPGGTVGGVAGGAPGTVAPAKRVMRDSFVGLAYRSDKEGGDQRVNRRDGSRLPANQDQPFNTEGYSHIEDNPFRDTANNPLSTLSIDVDTASYTNVRRYLDSETRPPKDAVRIEELVNYFDYDYQGPDDEHPFAVRTGLAECPWAPDHWLMRVALQAHRASAEERPAANLVFLVDVSGSMRADNKLELVKKGLDLLVDNLQGRDHVAIVVYAGAAGEVLPSTSGNDKAAIRQALAGLEAGGSTHGSAGLRLAYEVAKRNYIQEGINRVILATDGDFNVGVSNRGDLIRMIEVKRREGVFLTTLGFGMGNLKDDTLESLADHGNGNYAYVDSEREARRIFSEQLTGTLWTVAKDVKIQIEFNPQHILSYRLIGYENRVLAAEDFNDDRKDAGEIGAGHNVTAFFELVPAGTESPARSVDPLRYQQPQAPSAAAYTDEIATLKVRYKPPQEDTSLLMEFPIHVGAAQSQVDDDFRFAAGVAAFGMVLRGSPYKGSADMSLARRLASAGIGADPEGRRAEFLRLLSSAERVLPKAPEEPER